MAFVLVGLSIAGCADLLPKPEYSYVKTPAPIRVLPDGTRLDDRGYHLDAQGYRLDRKGELLGGVDFDEKIALTLPSNAVAGYYISSLGIVATGSVATPSEGARAGGYDYAPEKASTSNVPQDSNVVVLPVAASSLPRTTVDSPYAPPRTYLGP